MLEKKNRKRIGKNTLLNRFIQQIHSTFTLLVQSADFEVFTADVGTHFLNCFIFGQFISFFFF